MNQRQRDHEFRRYFWEALICCWFLLLFWYIHVLVAFAAALFYLVHALIGVVRYWR